MSREQLLGLAADVDRLLAAGATAAAGHDGLARRGRTLRELGQKVAALASVADTVERVVSSSPSEAGRVFLDLVVMTRQIRGSLAAVGVEGTLQTMEASGPWQTPMPTREVNNIHESLMGESSSSDLHDAAERQVAGDLRLLPSALAALESKKLSIADTVADNVLPAVGCGVLPDLLNKLDIPKGKAADARRLRAICKIDSDLGADLVRKALSEGSPAMKIQALECLPDVGQPGEAEKTGLAMWKEKKKEVRVAALRALRKATGDESLEVLIQALRDDDWQIIQAAQQSLAELPHAKTTERLLYEVEQGLTALLSPASKPKKGATNAEKAREAALGMLQHVIAALGNRKEVKNSPAVKTLSDLRHHAEPVIRLHAVFALAKLGPEVKEVVPALIEAAADADLHVAEAAVNALSGMPPDKRETAIPALLERIADSKCHQHTVYNILRMLPAHMPRFGDKILERMRPLLKGKDDYVRSGAHYALSAIGPAARKLLPEILEAIKTGWVCLNCNEIFVNIEPEGTTAIPTLIDLLKERNRQVRAYALQGLASYGPKAQVAEPLVAQLLKDRDGTVKYNAERTLAAIKGEM